MPLFAHRKDSDMIRTTPVSFSPAQRILHWATALLIFCNLIFSEGMERWGRAVRRTGIATVEQVTAANIHAYVGIAILVMASLQLLLRYTSGRPATPTEVPLPFQWASKIAHILLYLLMLGMPLSGIAAYYFGIGDAGDIHARVLKGLLLIILAAHILAAFLHQFYWKTNVMRRMTKG
jgi:cytochrome b561